MKNKEHNARVDAIAKGVGIMAMLVADGVIFFDGTEIVGIASDGTEVSIGDTREQDAACIYLASHPTPDTW